MCQKPNGNVETSDAKSIAKTMICIWERRHRPQNLFEFLNDRQSYAGMPLLNRFLP